MSRFAARPLALSLLTSAIAPAQTATGSIHGTVHNPSNAVESGATIGLNNAGTRERRAVVTRHVQVAFRLISSLRNCRLHH
jgi:hypothetical protein